MKLIKFIPLIVIVIGFGWVNKAYSKSCTASTCTINSPTINFGTAFNPLTDTALQQTFSSVLTVTCTPLTGTPCSPTSHTESWTISFPAGTHGTIAARYMQSSTPHTLNFNIYTSSSYSTVLGNTGGTEITGSCTVTTSAGCTTSYSIYGEIPAQPSADADVNTYTDAIVMTLTYS